MAWGVLLEDFRTIFFFLSVQHQRRAGHWNFFTMSIPARWGG
jgi:hypothetical protein